MRYALVNGYVLDGTEDMQPQAGVAVIVHDEIIEAIVLEEELEADIERVDLEGSYLMPGLINLHTHLIIGGAVPKNDKPTDYRKLVQMVKKFAPGRWYIKRSVRQSASDELLSGVTTLRSVGGIDAWDGYVRDEVLAGKVIGPRILSANTAVSVPDGHFAGALATEAHSPEEAAAHVRQIAETNPDCIKLMITGGVMDATEAGEPGALRMPLEYVTAACDEAHKLGYQVAAHVESPEGVRVALAGGVDTIEHGAQPTDEIMQLFKDKGAACICTLSPAVPYVLMPMEIAKCGQLARDNGTIVLDGIIECAKRCLAEGVPVGLGTDSGCPFISHYDMWRELEHFVRFCDATPEFALHTATLVNARIIGLDHEIGSIEPGKKADFIVSEKNPLDDFENLRTLKMVARDGNIINNPRPKKNPDIEAAFETIAY